MNSLRYIDSKRTNKELENQEANMVVKFKANLGNTDTNKKLQTTALDVVNKVTRDGMP